MLSDKIGKKYSNKRKDNDKTIAFWDIRSAFLYFCTTFYCLQFLMLPTYLAFNKCVGTVHW